MADNGKRKRELNAVEERSAEASDDVPAKKTKAEPKVLSVEELRPLRAREAANAVTLASRDGWKGGYHLSTNINSTCLWVRPDANGKIANRMIVKHCRFMGSPYWMDPRLWYGNVNDLVNRTPVELKCMQQLYDCGSDRKWTSEVRYFSRMDLAKQEYVFYMPYYPYKDLLYATNYYARLTNPTTEFGLPQSEYDTVKDWLPEPFLWSIFEGLAKGCLLMEQGTLDKRNLRYTWWEPIVHNDLKSSNVFIGPPDKELWKSYPRPVIADFDRAFILPRWPTNNPEYYRGQVGTPGWFPPESDNIRFAPDPEDQAAGKKVLRITPRSNIWAIGTIMARLVRLGCGQEELVDYDYDEEAEKEVAVDPLPDKYSTELIKLIGVCVKYDPDDRPSAEKLVNIIARLTDETGQDLGRGLKTGPAVVFDPTESPDTRLGVPYQQWDHAKFAIGAIVPPIPTM